MRAGEDDPWCIEHRSPTEGRRTRLGRSRRGLAGRDAERETLDALWSKVQAGTGQVLLLRGEAGMGKSRLLEAWLDTIEGPPPGAAVLSTGHSPGVGAGPSPPCTWPTCPPSEDPCSDFVRGSATAPTTRRACWRASTRWTSPVRMQARRA
ncbi:MAG: ATP-binding protein [Planctomycetota bacterium]